MTRRPVAPKSNSPAVDATADLLGSLIYVTGAVAFISWIVMFSLSDVNVHVGFWVTWFIGMFIVAMVRIANALDA